MWRFEATTNETFTADLTALERVGGLPTIDVVFDALLTGSGYYLRGSYRLGASGVWSPWSSISGPIVVASLPGAPAVNSATINKTTATRTFSAPDSNGGLPIESYQAACRSSNGAVSRMAIAVFESPTIVSGLVPGHTYSCALAARSEAGLGAYSQSSAPLQATAGPIYAPSNITVASGDTYVTVIWKPLSAGANGQSVAGYMVQSGGVVGCVATGALATQCRVGGLQNGISYNFQVNVFYQNAAGTLSAAVRGTPHGIPLAGEPGVLVGAVGDVSGGTPIGDAVAALVPDSATKVLMLGDLQYQNGELAKFRTLFDSSYGPIKDRIAPVPGNHEYQTPSAAGYYSYFGAASHPETSGFYDFYIGAWHVYALNSNCGSIGGCGATSAQYLWLANSLAHDPPGKCQVAMYHHPAVSDGSHGDSAAENDPGFALLANSGVELVLSGHEHTYQRFAPIGANREQTVSNGTVQIVSGLGGVPAHSLTKLSSPLRAANTTTPGGMLFLKLDVGAWASEYRGLDGYTDTSKGSCGLNRNVPSGQVPELVGDLAYPVARPALEASSGSMYAITGSSVCDPSSPGFNHGDGLGSWCRTKQTLGLLDGKQLAGTFVAGVVQQNPSRSSWAAGFDTIWDTTKSGPVIATPAEADYDIGSGFASRFGAASLGLQRIVLDSGWTAYVLPASCNPSVVACPDLAAASTQLRTMIAADGPGACQIVLGAYANPTVGYSIYSQTVSTLTDNAILAGADVVVSGFERSYQRFDLGSPTARTSLFQVGTGGISLWQATHTDSRLKGFNDSSFGMLFMKLQPSGFAWEYQTVDGNTPDEGTGSCR